MSHVVVSQAMNIKWELLLLQINHIFLLTSSTKGRKGTCKSNRGRDLGDSRILSTDKVEYHEYLLRLKVHTSVVQPHKIKC